MGLGNVDRSDGKVTTRFLLRSSSEEEALLVKLKLLLERIQTGAARPLSL